MAKAMAGMAAALGGKTPTASRSSRSRSRRCRPPAEGLGLGDGQAEGERMTSPVPFSKIETDYQNGEQRIDV